VTIGERVKELRERKGMTPAQLAAKAGVTDGAITQIEAGETKDPRFSTGLRIARALDASPFWLAFGMRRGDIEPTAENELLLEAIRRIEAIEKQIKPTARRRAK
jgi:transcriptional regulator with XRE-family HTH domain